jgi:outer membrane cobalamin receptor
MRKKGWLLGIRNEFNSRLNTFSIDPRVSLAYKTGPSSQLGFAYGNFRQSPKNEWLYINAKLKPEKAQHYILSFQKIENNRTFRVESYYKRYSDLVKYTSVSIANLDNSGDGYAKGIELFWRDNETFKSTDYWISYSFLDTKRNYLDFPYKAIPAFASAHNFSAVYKYFIQRIKSQLGFTYSFASGRPYYNPNNKTFNSDRTPHYTDFSFNWSYLPKPYLIVYFSCTNVLGRNNVFGYEYSSKVSESGSYASRPVEQPAKRFLFIGIFLTLTKDKTINQLPSL